VGAARWYFGVEVVTELEEAEFSQVALFFLLLLFLFPSSSGVQAKHDPHEKGGRENLSK